MTLKTVFKTSGARRQMDHFVVDCGPGEYLFREGDLGTEMYIIQEGSVEILRRVDGEEVRIALLEKGDFFGEMALLEELPRTASARTAKSCRLLQINGSTFDEMLRSNPEIGIRMMRKLSRRIRQLDEQFDSKGLPRPGGESLPLPATEAKPKRVAAEKLVHVDTDTLFHLSAGSESTIGRHDPVTGIHPDVDLSEIDVARSTSRRHAKIYRRGSKFFLTEEIGVTNGTFINSNRLETGVPFELHPGDQVQFGLVKMDFLAD